MNCRSFVIALAALPALAAGQQTAPKLDETRFEQLMTQLAPDAAAPWRSIEWRIDLLAAQREAAASNKPLFIWAMDGHPLGCT